MPEPCFLVDISSTECTRYDQRWGILSLFWSALTRVQGKYFRRATAWILFVYCCACYMIYDEGYNVMHLYNRKMWPQVSHIDWLNTVLYYSNDIYSTIYLHMSTIMEFTEPCSHSRAATCNHGLTQLYSHACIYFTLVASFTILTYLNINYSKHKWTQWPTS